VYLNIFILNMKKLFVGILGLFFWVFCFVWFSNFTHADDETGDKQTDMKPSEAKKDNGGTASSTEIGIDLSDKCLKLWWRDCLKIDYLLFWKWSTIAKRNENRDVLTVAQDVVLAATFLVWTVLAIVLMYCWLMYIFASANWKDPSRYGQWLVKAAIWAVLVWSAYGIVRLIQYIAGG
jgi:hypothetical protein